MVQKGRFDILYDNTLDKSHILRATSQKFPFIWTPQAGNDNVGLLSLGSKGTYTGEIERTYITYITINGTSGEAKFKYSKDGGDTYFGFEDPDWVPYNGSNGRLVEFSDIALTEGVEVLFGGSESGEVGDRFLFKAGYRFPLENAHDLRPNRTFRAETDQLNWEAVWDLGSYGFLRGDMACFTGFNVPQLTFQANDTDTWSSPSVEKSIGFVDETGIINDVKQTRVVVNSATWMQKEHIDKYLKITSGTAINKVYIITDNYTTELVLLKSELLDDGVAINDTFEIFSSDRQIRLDNEFIHRYVRMSISSGETHEGYFQGSALKIGKSLDLDVDYQQGESRRRDPNVSITQSVSGNEQVDWKGQPGKTFTVNFDFLNTDNRDAIDAASDYLQDSKTPFFFIPDRNISGEVHPVRFTGNKNRDIPVDKRSSESWTLKEIR